MKRPTLTLIAGSTQTKTVLYDQLQQLAGDYIAVRAFAIDETLPHQIDDHVILYSSETTKKEAASLSVITGVESIVGKRTIRHDYIDRLLTIPQGERVLMVNDDDPSTIDVIESLYQLGINHVTFLPFKRGQMYYDNIEVAVSPGETHLCPSYIPTILDIGVRPFDMATIINVMDYFQLDDSVSSKVSERYIRSMIALHRKILVAEQEALRTTEHYQNVVNTVDDGILAINKEKKITLFNQRLEALFQLQANDVIGLPISNVVDQDLQEFMINGAEENKFVSMNGVDVVAFRQSIPNEVSTVVTFKSVNQAFEIEKTAQREQHKKGFAAKYDFDDILGEHPLLLERVRIAKKLAIAEHPVLINGETGVGKELFAHAIHRSSLRKNGPFIAINCSALTETLLESELFGYEEGTFTGAQRGGKKGLFELADNGTIFLDEIGDISATVQAHLLRVLQEKEIRRIGGRKITPINVRVIAATNKNLEQKIIEGTFRSDLFYRLNVLQLSIPPLRDRKSDIQLLTNYFVTKSGTWMKVDPQVIEAFIKHQWPGNIRELKSMIDYALVVASGSTITMDDLPHQRLQSRTQEIPLPVSSIDAKDHYVILQIMKTRNDEGKPASRDFLSKESATFSHELSPQQIRLRLNDLENKGYVVKGRGRAGTQITLEGEQYLAQLLSHEKAARELP
ncbi:sigma-54 interaction domain-containing protein [Pseudalkalibacillus hwajinpoensis]|uniref:sigma-54 interaction domain-containing protein n=1 Tax=Guptibacillus hwajinpoensis TaxID=208199 RepID=UPI001CFF3A16|nr:sigma 54-interacting transcriptional regulator [Pseudalkalibacillus hwajinpoensis]